MLHSRLSISNGGWRLRFSAAPQFLEGRQMTVADSVLLLTATFRSHDLPFSLTAVMFCIIFRS